MVADAIQVTLMVAGILEDLSVPYVVGGSLASSLQGIPRATQDVDIVADLAAEHLDPLVAALEQAFYIDRDAMAEAIRVRGSFNAIHLDTMFKVDVFVLGDEPAFQRQMARRQSFVVDERTNRSLHVASAEDVIMVKLYGYRLGGETSDRHWNDVLGVLKVQAPKLDLDYLDISSREMGLLDLLQRALEDAGIDRTRNHTV